MLLRRKGGSRQKGLNAGESMVGVATDQLSEPSPTFAICRSGRCPAVKPNETSAQPGNAGAVTQPDILGPCCRSRHLVQEWIVSGGWEPGKPDEVFRIVRLVNMWRSKEQGAGPQRPPFVGVELDSAAERRSMADSDRHGESQRARVRDIDYRQSGQASPHR